MPPALGSSVAVVLPGGGARGAYEAGAMSELLPALEARGEHVSIFCGTSVGAINAAKLASMAHLSAAEQADDGIRRWTEMRKGDVIRRILGPSLPWTLLRALGEALELPGMRLAALLDPAPLRDSLERWIDWDALRSNVRSGRAEAVCVVATDLARGGPVAFVEGGALPARRPSEKLQFQRVRLTGEHVRASAAIPLLFPPVEVTSPRAARGHYIDGGTRLNTPIKPALALGADKVIVVGFEPFASGPPEAANGRTPRLADVAANMVDGLLVDQVSEDLRRLVAINSFFAEHAGSGTSPSARAYRRARGRPPYRRVSYALVSPETRGEIGALAERVFARRYGGLRGLRAPDFPLLARVIGARGRSRGELLSFLLFDEEFVGELVELGRRDARRWLERHPGFWCHDPAHDFDFGPDDSESALEEHALDEWRSLHRL
jgi:NTE family protein